MVEDPRTGIRRKHPGISLAKLTDLEDRRPPATTRREVKRQTKRMFRQRELFFKSASLQSARGVKITEPYGGQDNDDEGPACGEIVVQRNHERRRGEGAQGTQSGAVGDKKATATTHPLHLQSHRKLMEGTRGADGVEIAEFGGGGRR